MAATIRKFWDWLTSVPAGPALIAAAILQAVFFIAGQLIFNPLQINAWPADLLLLWALNAITILALYILQASSLLAMLAGLLGLRRLWDAGSHADPGVATQSANMSPENGASSEAFTEWDEDLAGTAAPALRFWDLLAGIPTGAAFIAAGILTLVSIILDFLVNSPASSISHGPDPTLQLIYYSARFVLSLAATFAMLAGMVGLFGQKANEQEVGPAINQQSANRILGHRGLMIAIFGIVFLIGRATSDLALLFTTGPVILLPIGTVSLLSPPSAILYFAGSISLGAGMVLAGIAATKRKAMWSQKGVMMMGIGVLSLAALLLRLAIPLLETGGQPLATSPLDIAYEILTILDIPLWLVLGIALVPYQLNEAWS